MEEPRLWPAPPLAEAEDDRRDGQRLRTVCRIAKILRVDDSGLWMVRNISDGGMMLTTNVAVQEGEEITIILADRLTIDGRVVWARDGKCGVEFHQEIDGEDLLRRLAEDKTARRYRPFRIAMRGDALARYDHRIRPIELANLSQHGAGILHDGTVTAGMRLDLMLAGGIRREAIVRWATEKEAGLWLTQPLERAALESVRALNALPSEARTAAPKPKPKRTRQKSCAKRP